jgi:Restriction endonuclease
VSALSPRGSTRAWRRIRAAVLARDAWRCHWCGRPAATVDHLVPRARGGDDNPANLTAACSRCNSSRGAGIRPPGAPPRAW